MRAIPRLSLALPATLPFALSVFASGVLLPAAASAQSTGAPPPDATALVAAPASTATVAKANAPPTDSTTAVVSAGGQIATGNSRLVAFTGTGKFDMRRGENGFGAAAMVNYGEAASPNATTGTPTPNTPMVTSTENFQGRLRYDRYFGERFSIFLIGTFRHDKFQGLDQRYNLDPGVKYIFVLNDRTTFWGELGYDFQYTQRNGSSLQVLDSSGDPIAGDLLSQDVTDHSVRAYVGLKHAFNANVNLITGIEYLQALYSSDQTLANESTDSRINFDALLAANVGAGFSFGLGFSARYDAVPLPGKVNTDTTTTFNLIYAFTDIAPPAPTCPCPAPVPPPPPPATTTTTTTNTPAAGATPTTTTTTTTPATPTTAPATTTTTTTPTTTTTTTTAPAPATPPPAPNH